MVKAYQIAPENRESPLDVFGIEDCCPEIILTGNRDYQSHNTELLEKAEIVIEDIDNMMENDCYLDFYESKEAAISDIVGAGTPEEWKSILQGYYYYQKSTERTEAITKAISLVAGKKYAHTTIQGCCQGEWQGVYYPVSEWSEEALKAFETEYFNEGEEWNVEDESGESISVYTIGRRESEQRQEIADAVDVKADEVELYVISGKRVVYDYKAV